MDPLCRHIPEPVLLCPSPNPTAWRPALPVPARPPALPILASSRGRHMREHDCENIHEPLRTHPGADAADRDNLAPGRTGEDSRRFMHVPARRGEGGGGLQKASGRKSVFCWRGDRNITFVVCAICALASECLHLSTLASRISHSPPPLSTALNPPRSTQPRSPSPLSHHNITTYHSSPAQPPALPAHWPHSRPQPPPLLPLPAFSI